MLIQCRICLFKRDEEYIDEETGFCLDCINDMERMKMSGCVKPHYEFCTHETAEDMQEVCIVCWEFKCEHHEEYIKPPSHRTFNFE